MYMWHFFSPLLVDPALQFPHGTSYPSSSQMLLSITREWLCSLQSMLVNGVVLLGYLAPLPVSDLDHGALQNQGDKPRAPKPLGLITWAC